MTIKINLFNVEIMECEKWANLRVTERILAGQYAIEEREKKYRSHRSGCLGEFAVCKHYKCEWTGVYYEGDSWKNRDWDTEIGEVRSTFHPGKYGGMIIKPTDKFSEAPFIWVILNQRGKAIVKAEFVGWFYKEDAKRDEWWNEEKGFWVVPRRVLKPIEELPPVVSE